MLFRLEAALAGLAMVFTASAAVAGETAESGDDPAATSRWTAYSRTGEIELRQTATHPDACHLECVAMPGAKVRWSAERCLGKKIDFRFVSDDGERVVVLHPMPAAADRWERAEVAHVYRRAEREYAVMAGAVLKSGPFSGRNVMWLGGTLGRSGKPPRYSADGKQIEFDTLEGNTHRIPLAAEPTQPERPPRSKSKRGR